MMPPAVGLRAHIELSRISGYVVGNTYHGTKHDASEQQPDKAIWMLQQWHATLPSTLQLTDGVTRDPACALLHMRYNQLLIVAIRPLFLTVVKRAVADRLMAQSLSGATPAQTAHLQLCIDAATHNMRLARHVSGLNGGRKLLHSALHFTFHAAVCLILRPLVFTDASTASADVDFGIEIMFKAGAQGNTDGRRCGDTLQELRALVHRLLAPPDDVGIGTSSAPLVVPEAQAPIPIPMPGADDPVLYDELMTWMGDDWPGYAFAQ